MGGLRLKNFLALQYCPFCFSRRHDTAVRHGDSDAGWRWRPGLGGAAADVIISRSKCKEVQAILDKDVELTLELQTLGKGTK